jgi:lysozyme
MTIDTQNLRSELIQDEGLRLSPYRCTADNLTIGVGHNLDANPITERAAMVILEDDITACMAALDRTVPWWRGLPDPQQRAMVNMCFQLGIGGLGKFKRMLAALQARQFDVAAGEALNSDWAIQTPARAKRVAELMRSK